MGLRVTAIIADEIRSYSFVARMKHCGIREGFGTGVPDSGPSDLRPGYGTTAQCYRFRRSALQARLGLMQGYRACKALLQH